MADQLLQLPTQLHKAAHAADATAIANALAESPHATASTDNLEQTPLVLAVRARAADDDAVQNLANCTKLLCDAGSDVNHFDKNGESPLHLAVMSGGGVPKTAVVKVLIDAKADVGAISETFKMTPLQYVDPSLPPPPPPHPPSPFASSALPLSLARVVPLTQAELTPTHHLHSQLGRIGRTYRHREDARGGWIAEE